VKVKVQVTAEKVTWLQIKVPDIFLLCYN